MSNQSESDQANPSPDNTSNLGATGKYPEGKAFQEDEGELRFALKAADDRRSLIVRFGKPVGILAFSPEQAEDLAGRIEKHAAELVKNGPDSGVSIKIGLLWDGNVGIELGEDVETIYLNRDYSRKVAVELRQYAREEIKKRDKRQ